MSIVEMKLRPFLFISVIPEKNSTLFRVKKESKVIKEHMVKKAQG